MSAAQSGRRTGHHRFLRRGLVAAIPAPVRAMVPAPVRAMVSAPICAMVSASVIEGVHDRQHVRFPSVLYDVRHELSLSDTVCRMGLVWQPQVALPSANRVIAWGELNRQTPKDRPSPPLSR